ncbi:MAG: hypothetical protein V1724_01560 [Chloroflexota bacterium]
MAKFNVPIYIQNLMKPPASTPSSDRKVWSVPLNGVWLPFFTATNVTGASAISADVLGAPLRLAREQDGTPKFSSKGKPVIRVVRELSDQIKMVRENYVAALVQFAATVQKAMPEEYKAQVQAAHEAGAPIMEKDVEDLTAYMEALAAAANAAAPTPRTQEAEAPKDRELVAA